MNGRIWYDKRTGKFTGTIELQDGTEKLPEYASEGEMQLAWLNAALWLNNVKPSELGAKVPVTENLETPNPLAKFTDADIALEHLKRTVRT